MVTLTFPVRPGQYYPSSAGAELSGSYHGHSSNTDLHHPSSNLTNWLDGVYAPTGVVGSSWSGASGFYTVSSNYINFSSNAQYLYYPSSLGSSISGVYLKLDGSNASTEVSIGSYGLHSDGKISGAGLTTDRYIRHAGDSNTYLEFIPDNIYLYVSGQDVQRSYIDGSILYTKYNEREHPDYRYQIWGPGPLVAFEVQPALWRVGMGEACEDPSYTLHVLGAIYGTVISGGSIQESILTDKLDDNYYPSSLGKGVSSAVALNTIHRQDNTQAHSDYLLNNANDITNGELTANGYHTTGFISGAIFSGGKVHSQDISNPMSLSGQISGMQMLTNLYASKPIAGNHMGEIIRVSGGANEKTWIFMSAKNDTNSWEWIQLGMST